MSDKPRILIDIDGVLVNFLKRYAEYYFKDTGKFVNWHNIDNYDLRLSMPTLTKYKYLYDPEFYTGIDFLPGAISTIDKLYEDQYLVQFVTAAVTKESMVAKFDLLSRTFSWFHIEKNWMVLSRKQLLFIPNSVIIDDNPHFFEESQLRYNICFAWEHNKHLRGRVNLYTDNWLEIYSFIRSLK